MPHRASSKLVQIISQRWKLYLQVLSLSDGEEQFVQFSACLVELTHLQVLPVIEHTLRECLPTRLLTQSGHETEGLGYWQVRLNLQEWRSLTRVLLKNAATAQIHA